MSGTAKEAERAQALRHRAAQGDQAAIEELKRGDHQPDTPPGQAHDPGHDVDNASPRP